MHVGGVIISHRKLGAFSRFPIERHLFLDPLTQTQSLIPSVITWRYINIPALCTSPWFTMGSRSEGLSWRMLKCYIMIKKYVGSILLWLTASVKGAQMERKFINKNSNFCKKNCLLLERVKRVALKEFIKRFGFYNWKIGVRLKSISILIWCAWPFG